MCPQWAARAGRQATSAPRTSRSWRATACCGCGVGTHWQQMRRSCPGAQRATVLRRRILLHEGACFCRRHAIAEQTFAVDTTLDYACEWTRVMENHLVIAAQFLLDARGCTLTRLLFLPCVVAEQAPSTDETGPSSPGTSARFNAPNVRHHAHAVRCACSTMTGRREAPRRDRWCATNAARAFYTRSRTSYPLLLNGLA